ncbi:C-type lectin mannose-binding isoform-like [Pecten maximus]|uniref:C-type lectin mannose-binding isoform-like n=1 Tax=Pecten maximus TaxID=6579 RepID=UPI0014589FD0|nr:C-type lectin mannose-binding isoform-like [Pecten maximus]
MRMYVLLCPFLSLFIPRATASVPTFERESTWALIGSLDGQLEYGGQVWILDDVSRLKCSVECTTDSSCQSLFYNSQIRRCVALSKQPEDFDSLSNEPGYSFYHNRPGYCESTYSYRHSIDLCFKLYNVPRTHADAQAACNVDGGHLIRVDTQAKQDYIRHVLQTHASPYMFIEATDEATEGIFLWGDGRTVAYTDWFSTEPNNEAGIENCIMLANSNYEWYDTPCDALKTYICEISA